MLKSILDFLLYLFIWIVLIFGALWFGINPAKACTDNKATLTKIEAQLSMKIYSFYFSKLDRDISESGIALMWIESKKKAHMITMDNFSCREFDLMKVKVLRELKSKQNRG
jgi:hypothetical protein